MIIKQHWAIKNIAIFITKTKRFKNTVKLQSSPESNKLPAGKLYKYKIISEFTETAYCCIICPVFNHSNIGNRKALPDTAFCIFLYSAENKLLWWMLRPFVGHISKPLGAVKFCCRKSEYAFCGTGASDKINKLVVSF